MELHGAMQARDGHGIPEGSAADRRRYRQGGHEAHAFFRERIEQLARYAEAQFRLDRIPKDSKQSTRVSLTSVWKQTGRKPQQLAEAGDLPEELAYIWRWYYELVSPNPLTYTEIRNWSEVTGNQLRGWEAELIKSIDRIFWKVQHE